MAHRWVAVLAVAACGTGVAPATVTPARAVAHEAPEGAPDGCVRRSKGGACSAMSCGPVSDGCGGFFDCGTCAPGSTCVVGTYNRCQCVPSRQFACTGSDCGTVSWCGVTFECGTCAAPQTCGGGGRANVCGCKPSTC